MDSLSPTEFAFEQSHINESNGPRTIGVVCMFIVLCSAALAGRFYARRIRKASIEADDYLAVAATIFFMGIAIQCFCLVHYGIGKDGVGVTLNMFMAIAKFEFALEVTYAFATTLAKASVLMLYHRVFSLRAQWFRIAWWTNVGLLASYFLGIILQTFLQCTPQPINSFWNPNDPCHPASNLHAIVFGAWNAFVDITILALPVRMVWSLHMGRKQKIAVSGIFLLGFVGTIMTVMRIVEAVLQDADFSYSTIDTLPIWTIEPAVAIICACLPVLRPLFAGILDKKKGGATYSNSSRSYPKKGAWINIKSSEDNSCMQVDRELELQSSNKDMRVIVEDKV